MIPEAITILSQRENLYNSIIKAEIFEELKSKYETKQLGKLIIDKKNGTWGQDFLKDGYRVKVLRSQDIRHGQIDIDKAEIRYISKVDFSKHEINDGDILVIKSNGSEDLVGKSQIFHRTDEKIVPSNFIMRIRADKKLIYPEYLDLFLKSPQALSWRVNKQSTTTGLRNLNTEGYLSVEIPLPEINEQKDIVKIYNSFLTGDFTVKTKIFDISRFKRFKILCDVLEKLGTCFSEQQTYLQQLRQAILQEAVQGKLTKQNKDDEPASALLKHIKAEKQKMIAAGKLKKEKELPPITNDEIPFELPKGWVWCRINDLLWDEKNDIRTGPFGSSLNKSEHKNVGVPVLGIESISKQGEFTGINKIFVTENKAKSLQSFYVKGGDLILSRSGTIGELCVLPEEIIPSLISTNLLKISLCSKIINSTLFCYIVKGSSHITNSLTELCGGTTRLFLTQAILKKLIFPIPPLSEQKRIITKVQQLQQILKQLDQQLVERKTQAQQLLQAALKEAFTNKGKFYEMNEKVMMVAAEKKVKYKKAKVY